MKKLVSWAVRNPVTVTMAVLAILLLGKISYDRLSVELLPSMNSPRLFVEIDAGERPPEEIEKQFVRSMESQIARQSDVRSVSSVVKVGTARITVEYAWRKNMDEAFLDLEKAMSSFSQDSRVTDLRISQKDPTTAPIMIVGFSNPDIPWRVTSSPTCSSRPIPTSSRLSTLRSKTSRPVSRRATRGFRAAEYRNRDSSIW